MYANLDRGEIFIVDDDAAVREVYSAMVTEAGWRAASFASGASFVAAGRMPAAVILDMYMPGRSGLDILGDIDARNTQYIPFLENGIHTGDNAHQTHE